MSAGDARVVVRNTEPRDFAGIIALTEKVYPTSLPWAQSQLRSHLEQYAEGQFVAVDEADQRIVGMAASLVVLWDDYQIASSWRDFTDRGMFTNHDPANGRTLYGAEVMVDPSQQGRGIGSLLYVAREQLVRSSGLLRIRAGARLRGYHRVASAMSAPDYVSAVLRREQADATLTFQLHRGFRVLEVVSGYLGHDPESLGHAAVIEWVNAEVATPAEMVHSNVRYDIA